MEHAAFEVGIFALRPNLRLSGECRGTRQRQERTQGGALLSRCRFLH
jgi:hypothetical protein